MYLKKSTIMESKRKQIWSSYLSLKRLPNFIPMANSNRKIITGIDQFLEMFNNQTDAKLVFDYFEAMGAPFADNNRVIMSSKDFYKEYCCDLQWAKDGGFCGASGTSGTSGSSGSSGTGGRRRRETSNLTTVYFTVEDIKRGINKAEKGMKGKVVERIQEELLKHDQYLTINADSEFGTRTKLAVIDFQKKMGIPETGVVDALTMLNLEQSKGSEPIKTLPTGTSGQSTEIKPKPSYDYMKDVQSKRIVTNEENIQNINEAETVDMSLAVRNNCFPQVKINEDLPIPTTFNNGKVGIIGKKSNGNLVYFYNDYTATEITSDGTREDKTWSCGQLKETKSLTADFSNLTPDQKKYVDFMTGTTAYSVVFPGQRAIDDKTYEKVDLNKENPELFKKPNEYFLYKQLSIAQKQRNKYEQIKNFIEGKGYAFDEPEDLGGIIKKVRVLDVMKQFRELQPYMNYFPSNPEIYQTKSSSFSAAEQQEGDTLETSITSLVADGKIEKQTCEKAIQFLFDKTNFNYNQARQGRPTKQYFSTTVKAGNVIDYAYNCQAGQSDKKGVLGIGKGKKPILSNRTQEQWDKLNTFKFDPSRGYYGFARGEIKESQFISKIVRKKLTETLEKKQKTITESKIINKRFGLLFEGKTFKTKKEKDELLIGIVSEILYLDSQNYDQKLISEGIDGLFSTLKSMFTDKGFEGIGQTLKERFAVWIAGKLGIESNSYFENLVISVIGNTPVEELPKLLTNCDFLVGKITKALPEAMIRKAQYNKGLGGAIGDVVRNSLYDMIEDNEFSNKVSNGLSTIICPLLSKLKDNLGGVFSGMKQRALTP